MPGFLPRSVAGAALVAALAAGCGSEATKEPSIAAGSSIVAPPTTPAGTPATSPATSAAAPRPNLPPAPRREGRPEEQCQVDVATWFPDREVLTVSFGTSVPAATVLARATDSTSATSTTSMTDVKGKGQAQLKVARNPVGRGVQVDISVAGGAKACSTTFAVTSSPIESMHGDMP